MKNVLFVATVSDFMHFEINDMKILQSMGYHVEVACNTDDGYDGFLDTMGITVHDIPFARSPFSSANISAYTKLKDLIRNGNYDFIHCHTPVGGVLTRLVNFFHKKNYKIIYTAHGFHFFKGAPVINWLLFFPIEWILSFKTDVLITITKEDYKRAKKYFHAKCIEYIPGVGVDLKRFSNDNLPLISKESYRENIGLRKDCFLILSVGELNDNKNHEAIIKAIAEIDDSDICYIIAGEGEKHDYLQELIHKLKLSNQVKLLGQRSDIPSLLAISDLFCHPSFREGLSVALMEAMSSSLPVICSRIRGNVDLISSGKKIDPFFPASDITAIGALIKKLKNDKNSLLELGTINASNVKSFSLEIVSDKMNNIYNNLISDCY